MLDHEIQQLADLYDKSCTLINEKLSTLTVFAGGTNKTYLLECLRKCDLDVERAADYFFSNPPPPSQPKPVLNPAPRQNHVNFPKRKRSESPEQIRFSPEPKRFKNNQGQGVSVNHSTDVLNWAEEEEKLLDKNVSASNPVLLSMDSDDDDEDSFDLANQMQNNVGSVQNNDSAAKMFEELKVLRPFIKEYEFKQNGKWDVTSLKNALGTANKESTGKTFEEPLLNMDGISDMKDEELDEDMNDTEVRSIEKAAQRKVIGRINIELKLSAESRLNLQQISRRCVNLASLKKIVSHGDCTYVNSDHENVIKELENCSNYMFLHIETNVQKDQNCVVVSLVLSLKRSADKQRVKLSETLKYLNASDKKLIGAVDNAKIIGKSFVKRKLPNNLTGLLDFACREEMRKTDYLTVEEKNNRENPYDLNINLHNYQIQSTSWMYRRERCKNGIYDEFAQKITTQDYMRRTFYYSPDFQLVSFDPYPRVSGGILCEEMGLGKTIEMMALVNLNPCSEKLKDPYTITNAHGDKKKIYSTKATLIVAPTSLVGQWSIELDDKCLTKPRILKYYGSSRPRDPEKIINDYDYVLTTYGIMQQETGVEGKAAEILAASKKKKKKKVVNGVAKVSRPRKTKKHTLHHINWYRIVLDESQTVKTRITSQAKSCFNLIGQHRWCLTGTPFSTSLKDLHGQLEFVGLKEPLNSAKWWDQQEKEFTEKGVEGNCGPLLKVVNSCVMRHKKSQKFDGKQLVTLPPRHEETILLEFTKQEMAHYKKLYEIAKHKWDTFEAQGRINSATLQLRQALLPMQMAASGSSVSVSQINELINNVRNTPIQAINLDLKNVGEAKEDAFGDQEGECPVCLEPIEIPMQTPCRHVFCQECIVSVITAKPECPLCRAAVKPSQLKKPKSKQEDKPNKKMEVDLPESSSDSFEFTTKLNYLIKDLKRLRKEKPNEKILIFSMYKDNLQQIVSALSKNKLQYRTLRGDMSMQKRTRELEAFIKERNCPIFVLSVRSGAVGITLTAASHIYMMQPLLNPAMYQQAINRVHRLGQKRQVYIKNLVIKNTVEEKVQKVAKSILEGSKDSLDNGSVQFGNKKKRGKTCISGDKLGILFQE